MVSNKQLISNMIHSIQPLIDRVVFVGGATTFLYLTPDFDDVRPTLDVDLIIDGGLRQFQRSEGELRKLGFQPDQELHCRWKKDTMILDLIPTDRRILGFSNQWHQKGISHAISEQVDGHKIKILPVAYFLASKVEAPIEDKTTFMAAKMLKTL